MPDLEFAAWVASASRVFALQPMVKTAYRRRYTAFIALVRAVLDLLIQQRTLASAIHRVGES